MFSQQQLKRVAAFKDEDLVQIGKCRRLHNRLGFGYRGAFVRLFNRFPKQQPFEVVDELVSFSAAQLGFDAPLIEFYRKTATNDLRAPANYHQLPRPVSLR